MVTHQSALTPISDFFPTSEVVTMWQTDSAAHKLKPRLSYKSAHFRVHPVDFYPGINHTWQYYQTFKSAVTSEQFHLLNPLLQFYLQFNLTNSHFKVQMALSHYNSSTPVPPLRTLFNTISCFSDQMAYPPNVPQCSRQIHQRDCSFPRSSSSTI